MHNFASRIPFSPVALSGGAVAILALVYVTLIAIVMSYATLTIEFSQSVRSDEATVASLESAYLARVAEINSTDYVTEGYAKPVAQLYVPAKSVTALR